MDQVIEHRIREFIAERFLFQDTADEIAAQDSLFRGGIIDSTGVLELVMFLQECFEITIDDADVIPENFDTIYALVAFVTRRSS